MTIMPVLTAFPDHRRGPPRGGDDFRARPSGGDFRAPPRDDYRRDDRDRDRERDRGGDRERRDDRGVDRMRPDDRKRERSASPR